ncbi:TPA: ead/Ea22-like family protein [Escherichia coli]|nr:ead/Ea22-like family protein [Escherichia coli]
MNKIDYQVLREAAENATPGEWCTDDHYGVIADAGLNANYYIASCSGPDNRSNKRFIAAANPAVVLALLDELERNQQYIKRRDQENEDIALTVGKLRVELEAEKQRAKVLFMENARLKSGIYGLIHLGIRYADVEVMKIAGDAQLSTPCTDSIINSIATGIRITAE